ncbi:MAG: metal ABC transporter solute-binding protein, Zn/Mn family [Verrucomicrobiota bacterium]
MLNGWLKKIACLLIIGWSGTIFSHAKIFVGASIAPVAFLIEQVGKEKVEVMVMIPPGGSPHTYEPTPQQLAQVSKADLFVKVGSGIEFELAWMDKVISLNKKMKICDASRGVEWIEMEEEAEKRTGSSFHLHRNCESETMTPGAHHHHGAKDPHIWMSIQNAIIMTKNICGALAEVDSANKDFYTQNADALIGELTALKNEIEQKLGGVQQRSFFIFHPSWGYFAKEFGLTQIAIEQQGKDPAPQQLARLIQSAKKQNVRVIFAAPQFSRKSAEVVSQEIHGKVLLIDNLSKNYIQNLRQAADAFAENTQ